MIHHGFGFASSPGVNFASDPAGSQAQAHGVWGDEAGDRRVGGS